MVKKRQPSKNMTEKDIVRLEQKIKYYEQLLEKTREAQNRAKENEEKFRALFQMAHDAILILDEDRIAECNSRTLDLFHCDKEEIINKDFVAFSPKFQPSGEKSDHRILFYIGEALQGKPQLFQWEHKRFDGNLFDAEVSLNRIQINGTYYLQAIIRDVSERIRTQRELKEKNLQYESLFHNSLVGIWRMEFEQPIMIEQEPIEIARMIFNTGYISDCNNAFARMYGADSREELIGRKISRVSINEQQTIERLLKMIQNDYKIEILDNEETDINGNLINLRNSYFGQIEEGFLCWMWGIQLDLTEQKILEKQLLQSQKMEAIGMLAGGIAHDFNNLLTVINGYSDLIGSQIKAGNPLYKHISSIRQAGQKAADLTGQLLAFSRKQILQPKVILMNDIIEHMIQMIERLIGEHIEVKKRLASELGQVKVDPVKVEQILINLVINARDAMPDGGILTISTANTVLTKKYTAAHPGAKTGKYVRLEIRDTGNGIEKEKLEHIFEPFYTTKDKALNTGLGLATVYGIIKQSNGYIDVVSKPGKGTTFFLYFPRVDDVIEFDVDVKKSLDRKSIRGDETILIVEDAENVRQVIRESMDIYGYTILEAGDGEEALQLAMLSQDPIHLVLTDIVMPGMDGYAFIKKLLPIRPHIKVLFMSGYTDDTIVRKGELTPGLDFIQKPFNLVELARKIRQILDSRMN